MQLRVEAVGKKGEVKEASDAHAAEERAVAPLEAAVGDAQTSADKGERRAKKTNDDTKAAKTAFDREVCACVLHKPDKDLRESGSSCSHANHPVVRNMVASRRSSRG